MSLKRPNPVAQGSSGRDRKKQKTADARTIHFQSGASSRGSGVITNSMEGLPGAIDVEKFTEARSFEIAAMQSAMESAKGAATQRAWQALPRSLRRRAASHDVRRVPVRLREKARAEMDPVKRKALTKRISKLGRSKKVSKTESFLKRQLDKTWLETHLWHAKRMHMKNVWGYRLADTPTQKSYRPSHRASVHGSILHDASYIGTISLTGKQFILEKMLSRCCDCQGAGPGAVRYVLGSRIHETHLYKADSYPFNLIAPITLIWKPLPPSSVPKETQEPTTTTTTTAAPESDPKSKKKKRKNKGKVRADSPPPSSQVSSKPSPHNQRTLWIRVHPSAWQDAWDTLREALVLTLDEHRQQKATAETPGEIEDETIDMADLRGYVNTFDIMGPKSSQVLKGALRLVGGEDRALVQQFWNQLKDLHSPGSVPRGMIIGLKVNDPRLFSPKNAKVSANTDNGNPSTSQPAAFSIFPAAELARSELWDEVEKEGGPHRPKFSKKDLDDRKAKNLTPGTPLTPLRQDDRIPIMLIQRTIGAPTSDISSIHGWTLLFPSHWSMPFLTSLIFTGTKVGGLRERRTQAFESGVHDFPFDFPLTGAYEKEEELSQTVEKDRWERKPPAKRVAWETVGTRSPWRADWEVVLGFGDRGKGAGEELLGTQREVEGQGMDQDEDGIRQRMWLLRGPDTPNLIDAVSRSDSPPTILLERINALRAKRMLNPFPIDADDLLKGALVSINLNVCGRGAPDDLAAIYRAKEDEAKETRGLLEKKRWGDVEGDADEELSKLSAEDSTIIGYVTTGSYSLARGQGYAVGAVSLAQLTPLMVSYLRSQAELYPLLVKVKDRESAVCRAATIEISTM